MTVCDDAVGSGDDAGTDDVDDGNDDDDGDGGTGGGSEF